MQEQTTQERYFDAVLSELKRLGEEVRESAVKIDHIRTEALPQLVKSNVELNAKVEAALTTLATHGRRIEEMRRLDSRIVSVENDINRAKEESKAIKQRSTHIMVAVVVAVLTTVGSLIISLVK